MTKENTLYIGIDPSMTATGIYLTFPWYPVGESAVFPATHFVEYMRRKMRTMENVVVAIEMPKKTDGNRATGVGNTRVVRACATQMVKDLKEFFPLRGPDRVKSRVICTPTPQEWRMWAYGRGGMTTEQAKPAAVELTGIKDHNIAEAAILCKLGEWWHITGSRHSQLAHSMRFKGQYSFQWLKEQFESEAENV